MFPPKKVFSSLLWNPEGCQEHVRNAEEALNNSVPVSQSESMCLCVYRYMIVDFFYCAGHFKHCINTNIYSQIILVDNLSNGGQP